MKISVNAEKDGIRLTIELQTNDYIGHKILTEDIENSVKSVVEDLLHDTGMKVINLISHEYQVRFPEGLK